MIGSGYSTDERLAAASGHRLIKITAKQLASVMEQSFRNSITTLMSLGRFQEGQTNLYVARVVERPCYSRSLEMDIVSVDLIALVID